MFVLSNMWFTTLMRQFFFNIDKIVFNGISMIYDFLITIARTSVLSQADIINMAGRIYKMLAIFMVFKVTFSLIMYVVNPDDFSDKTKGVGKLTTNIVISLGLLILTPYIFNMAYQLQTYILEDNALAVLIFGEDKVASADNEFDSAGEKMAYITMTPFFTPNLGIEDLYECVKLTQIENDGTITINDKCATNLKTVSDNSDGNFSEQTYKNYKAGIETQNLGILFRQEAAVATTGGKEPEYIIDYKYGFSTVIGVLVILLLVTFCMDVALRSIKLAFLQLIAPIPIISYVDPKSGKDGMFKKWYQMCFKTYISLFVRLLALYFAVYIISRVGRFVDVVDGSYVTNGLIAIAIIIGALMFAKQLPKILEGLGIKLDGDGKFYLNPFKKFSEQALGGKKILGGAKGALVGGTMGVAGALTGAGAGRAFTGWATGMKAGIQGKKAGEIRKDQANRSAEMRRAIASGSSFGERMGARFSSFAGTPGRLGRIQHDKMDFQNRIDNKTAEKKDIATKIAGTKRTIAARKQMEDSISSLEKRAQSKIENGEGKYGKEYLKLKAHYDYLAANGGSAEELADAEWAMKSYINDAGMKAYMSNQAKYVKAKQDFAAGKITKDEFKRIKDETEGDDAYDTMYKNYVANARAIGEEAKTNGDDLHTQLGVSKGTSGDLSRSIAGDEAKIQALDDEIANYSAQIEKLNADERDAKASVQAVHGQEGGPARPGSVTPVKHTVGYRVGGYGSGVVPAQSGFAGMPPREPIAPPPPPPGGGGGTP